MIQHSKSMQKRCV